MALAVVWVFWVSADELHSVKTLQRTSQNALVASSKLFCLSSNIVKSDNFVMKGFVPVSEALFKLSW